MMETASEHLARGDLEQEWGDSHVSPVKTGKENPAGASRASWLARRYTNHDRAAIGEEALRALSPSHLEAAVRLEPRLRTALLRRVGLEGLSVRELRRLAAADVVRPGDIQTFGGVADLVSTQRALELYQQWDDRSLNMLLAGPNGDLVRRLAEAGRTLAERINMRDTNGPGRRGPHRQ